MNEPIQIPEPSKGIRFSAFWTEELGKAIDERYPQYVDGLFSMILKGKDHLACIRAVNQGIDAHLQACYVPARGDRYICDQSGLACMVSRESLPVLVRRLLQACDNDGEPDDTSFSLGSSICQTLDIELV